MSNDTYFDDSWFSVLKTSEEAIAKGVYYYGQVKTTHKDFCLATLEKLMKNWPGGSYLIIKITLLTTLFRSDACSSRCRWLTSSSSKCYLNLTTPAPPHTQDDPPAIFAGAE